MKPGYTGLRRLVAASANSSRGLHAAFRREESFRQQLFVVGVLLVLSFLLATSLLAWLILVIPLFIMIIVELLNSAVESTVDRIGPEFHELSGQAKDMASAAVLLSLVLTAVTWGAVAWERFLA